MSKRKRDEKAMEVDGAGGGGGRRQQQQEQQAGEGDAEAEAGPLEDAAAEEEEDEEEEAMTPEKVRVPAAATRDIPERDANLGVWACRTLALMLATLVTCRILAFLPPPALNRATCCCHPTHPQDDYAGPSAGCTAVCAVVRDGVLWVANAGDSRCVLSRGGRAVAMTQDHKPMDTEEYARIMKVCARLVAAGPPGWLAGWLWGSA